ncbi:MAG: response regulator [Deltaproteobacteria bacterium]|nr:response regulator [Deltaproteobacteria bacterium]MBW2302767.1 response regulator [Deltaproteobacteria bacterium]
MEEKDILNGKKILIVDDEADILATLQDLLYMCLIDQAKNYEEAIRLLEREKYDAAILDIMGVRGYDLLDETTRLGIPTLMLTAHALSSDNFVKSIRSGAQAYLPKDRITEIAIFLRDVLKGKGDKSKRSMWFKRLESFFEEKFGADWRERQDPEFWKKYFYI